MIIHIIRQHATSEQIAEMLSEYKTQIKLAVDIERDILAGGGIWHADCKEISRLNYKTLCYGTKSRRLSDAYWRDEHDTYRSKRTLCKHGMAPTAWQPGLNNGADCHTSSISRKRRNDEKFAPRSDPFS